LKDKPSDVAASPVATFPYRDKSLFVWDAADVLQSAGRVMGPRY
jgi:hypothetical protein